uniref:Cystathionine beta-lyase n=1 Tax=Tetradesmus obliquus TaxID=3088 RepID=A0A383VV31_TETOB|eukprot:jgi/Sobl393_1/6756/SZX68624.1
MADPVERLASANREYGEYGGVNPSIEISTTFTVLDAKTLPDIFAGKRGPEKKEGACYLYGRSWSPTVHTLGRQLAALEDTEAAYAVASGMAAISSAIMALCNSGDHIVCSNCVYGGTFAFMKSYVPLKAGISVSFVDITDLDAVAAAFTERTKVLYTEVLSNPTLVVSDLPALARIAHAAGAQLVVDNTFTPLAVTPARWGADVVVHSMTKFISGASDIIAGAVCGSNQFLQQLMDLHTGPIMLQGPTMDPRIASELLLRLPHLPLRVQEHSRRAQAMAEMMEGVGAKVVYPGLPSHKHHAILKRMLNPGYGFGGLIGLDMQTPAKAEALMERLQNKHGFGLMAVSLGYADTLMSLSAASTSSELSESDKAKADISDGYVRMSVGITGSLEQRLQQLREAYTFVVACDGRPPFRATKVQRQPNGRMTELLSWPSGGPSEDHVAGSALEAAPAALAAHGPQAAVVLAAAAIADAGSRMVVGGEGWHGPHLHGQGLVAPATVALGVTASSAMGSDTCGNTYSDNDCTSDGEEAPRVEGGSVSPLTLTGVGKSRLGPSSSHNVQAVKIRKLDDDTHIVYTPLL